MKGSAEPMFAVSYPEQEAAQGREQRQRPVERRGHTLVQLGENVSSACLNANHACFPSPASGGSNRAAAAVGPLLRAIEARHCTWTLPRAVASLDVRWGWLPRTLGSTTPDHDCGL